MNKHFRFPNEAFTGKQVPQTRLSDKISLGCIPSQRDFLPAIGRLYKPFAFYVRVLFSFDVRISSCFPFFFLETDDTSSDSEEGSTEYEGGSSGDDYVERSFQVLFIDDADIPEVV